MGMKAKDGEYVEFSSVTKCVGPVSIDSSLISKLMLFVVCWLLPVYVIHCITSCM